MIEIHEQFLKALLLSSFKFTSSSIQTKQKTKQKRNTTLIIFWFQSKPFLRQRHHIYFNYHRKGQLLNYMMLKYYKWKQVIRLNIRRSKVCQCEMQHKGLCVQHIVMKMNQEDDNKKMVTNKTHNALHG